MYAYLIDVFLLLCKRTNDNLASFPTSRDSLKILLSSPVKLPSRVSRPETEREPSRLPRNSDLIIVYLVSCWVLLLSMGQFSSSYTFTCLEHTHILFKSVNDTCFFSQESKQKMVVWRSSRWKNRIFSGFFASHKEFCRNDQKNQKKCDKNDKILFLFLFTDSYMTFNTNNMWSVFFTLYI